MNCAQCISHGCIGKAKIPECNEKKIMKHVNGMYHAKYDTSKEAQEK